MATLADWCQTVAANLDTLIYDEKRLALNALGVQVRVRRENAAAEDGNSLPRWEFAMRPASSGQPVVSCSTLGAWGNKQVLKTRLDETPSST